MLNIWFVCGLYGRLQFKSKIWIRSLCINLNFEVSMMTSSIFKDSNSIAFFVSIWVAILQFRFFLNYFLRHVWYYSFPVIVEMCELNKVYQRMVDFICSFQKLLLFKEALVNVYVLSWLKLVWCKMIRDVPE